ncbi:cyclin-dependent kinase inhibitor 3-like [Rutidosis leptorrhynchoides]|uniref:cyclin-dependent kinase inhibitor 3-like n=1 Tax=Rutidosis leptorrhynchoides TaxID=125765 RepID=UPI003A99541C
MGKYMRKSNLSGDVVALMDVSQSSLGVRTRAKTLALQKLQASKTTITAATPPPEQQYELSYLQLRSRKLEKPPLQQLTCCKQRNPNPSLSTSQIEPVDEEKTEAFCDFGIEEASFGENNINFDCGERSTRESTPCSLVKDSNISSTPGSSTRPANRHAYNQTIPNSIQRIMPSAQEIEEFFARHALDQQRRFTEKYNFDIISEKPLQGRYEWMIVQP